MLSIPHSRYRRVQTHTCADRSSTHSHLSHCPPPSRYKGYSFTGCGAHVDYTLDVGSGAGYERVWCYVSALVILPNQTWWNLARTDIIKMDVEGQPRVGAAAAKVNLVIADTDRVGGRETDTDRQRGRSIELQRRRESARCYCYVAVPLRERESCARLCVETSLGCEKWAAIRQSTKKRTYREPTSSV